jgi:hypothetical protein
MEPKAPEHVVHVGRMVSMLISAVKSEERDPAPGVDVEETFRRMVNFVRRENGLRDERMLYPLKPYLGLLRWPQWRDLIFSARATIYTGRKERK